MENTGFRGSLKSRLLRFELWTLTSVIVFSLVGASLAWVGVTMFIGSQAQWSTEECMESCANMSEACYTAACVIGCTDPQAGCTASCDCGEGDQTPCRDGCSSMNYMPMDGTCPPEGCGDMMPMMGTEMCDQMYSPAAAKVVGYVKWESGTEIKYDLNWSEVGRCDMSAGGGYMPPPPPPPDGGDYYPPPIGDVGDYMPPPGGGGCTPGVPGYDDAYPQGSVTCPASVQSATTSTTTVEEEVAPSFLDERQKELSEFVDVIKEIDTGDIACMLRKIADLGEWEDYMNLYKDAREVWFGEMNARFGVDLGEFNVLEVCPEIVKEEVGASASCEDIERKCVLLSKPVLSIDGKEAFGNATQKCMDNKSREFGIMCDYSGNADDLRSRADIGSTCANDSECPSGWICNTWDFHERPPRKKGADFSAKIIQDVFLGRCESVPANKCLYDSHCSDGETCSQTIVCAKAPCWQQCVMALPSAKTHGPEDCRPFTREDIARKYNLESPGDIAKTYLSEIEDMGMSVEEFERCGVEPPRVDEPIDRGHGDDGARPDPIEKVDGSMIGEVFGRAISMLLDLTQKATEVGLGSDAVQIIQDAMLWFSSAIGEIAVDDSGARAGQLVGEARDWISKVKENVKVAVGPAEGADGESRRREMGTVAVSEIRYHLQEADNMIREGGWVDQILTGLEAEGYSDAFWYTYLDQARLLFYGSAGGEVGSVVDECGALLEGLYSDGTVSDAVMKSCFDGAEYVFQFLEMNMKTAIDKVVPEETLFAIISEIEGFPMDDGPTTGGPGYGPPGEGYANGDYPGYGEYPVDGEYPGYGGDGPTHGVPQVDCKMQCRYEYPHIARLVEQSETECVAVKAPQCVGRRNDPTCYQVVDRCESQYLSGADWQLIDTCERRCYGTPDGSYGPAGGGYGSGPGMGGGGYMGPQFEQSFEIRGLVDGRSELVIKGKTVKWRHFDNEAPGLWKDHNSSYDKGRGKPTHVNGEDWQPKWGPVQTYGCNGCESDSYDLPFSIEGKNVDVFFAPSPQNRENFHVVQWPTNANGFELIIEFNDKWMGGADWYSAKIGIVPSNGGGGGGMMTTGGCFYPDATQNGQSLGWTVWCEGDYMNCHLGDPSGDPVNNDGLSLGVPSWCENGVGNAGGGPGGGMQTMCSHSVFDNGNKIGESRCGEMGCDYFDLAGTAAGFCDFNGCYGGTRAQPGTFGASMVDGRNNMEIGPCGDQNWVPSGTSGTPIPGGPAYDCDMENWYAGVTCCNQGRAGDPECVRPMISMYECVDNYSSQFVFPGTKDIPCPPEGTPPGGTTPSGPGGPGSGVAGGDICQHSYVELFNGERVDNVLCGYSSGGCQAGNRYINRGDVNLYGPCDCDNDGMYEGCSEQHPPTGGGSGGGSTSAMRNCFYPDATQNGQSLGWTVWCEGDYMNCRLGDQSGDPVSNDGLSLGAPSWCESGWDGSGSSGSNGSNGSTSGVSPSGGSMSQCKYQAERVDTHTAEITGPLNEPVIEDYDGMADCNSGYCGPKFIGVDSGNMYGPGELAVKWNVCDCNGDGAFDDCGVMMPPPDGMMQCINRGVTIRSSGVAIPEDILCGNSGDPSCTGQSTGKRYAPEALDGWDQCDCNGDGVFDDCGGPQNPPPPPPPEPVSMRIPARSIVDAFLRVLAGR